jgi:hypothetical protein
LVLIAVAIAILQDAEADASLKRLAETKQFRRGRSLRTKTARLFDNNHQVFASNFIRELSFRARLKAV